MIELIYFMNFLKIMSLFNTSDCFLMRPDNI